MRLGLSLRVEILGIALALVLRALNLTLKWRLVGVSAEAIQKIFEGPPVVIAFWHDQQVPVPLLYRNYVTPQSRKIFVLSSQHGDGLIAARAVRSFGLRSIFGSSTRGGREASRELVEALLAGSHVVITPDGPRGPQYICKPGVVSVAQRAGAQIIPLGVAVSRAWKLRSWDKMFVPKPGATVAVAIGEPIRVGSELDGPSFDNFLEVVAQRINDATAAAGERLPKGERA